MSEQFSHDDLMRYLDGEMPPDERTRVEAEVERSTELQRELAIFKAMRADFQWLSFHPSDHHNSVWDQVNASVTRPMGWFLVITGITVWMVYGVYVFAGSPINPWEKLAMGAVVIGILTLLSTVIWERYREWGHDPYRDVHR